jgi:hypothetical protein
MSKWKKNQPAVEETRPEEIEGLIGRAERGELTPEEQARVSGLLRLFLKLVWVSQAKEATLARLRGLIFGKSTEKRKKDKGQEPPDAPSGADESGEKVLNDNYNSP